MIDAVSLRDIPSELKFSGLWCCWKLTEKGKEPFNLTNDRHAKSNDPTTFVSYPVLLNNMHKYLKVDETGKQIGGVGLGIFRGFSAVDIDHCVDSEGNISEMAKDIIEFCNSYTEYSPSKTGIRIIFKTNIKIDKSQYYINNANAGLEIYISDNTNKFVTITGNKLSGDKINEIDITYILDKYMKKGGFNIKKVLEKDEKLAALWNKQAPGSHADESETDMKLCCKLAYYLKNDENEIKRYFEMSPYYQSKDAEHKRKWNSDYSKQTIHGAVSYVGEPQPVVNSNKTYDLNDTGNAHRFIDMFGNTLRYNFDNKMWMIWNGKYWQYDVTESVKNYVEILAERMTYESSNIRDVKEWTRFINNIEDMYSSGGKESLLKEARHINGVPVLNSDFDKDQYLICTESGVINLRNYEVMPHLRDQMISMSTNCEIDRNNRPVRFEKFLNEIFADNKDVIHYVHKALGYSITNSTREQCMFILHGDGNNGKSLLLEVIRTALGGYGITSKPQLLTESNFATNNSEEIARLNGKRFCAVEEIKSGDKLDEQLVKSLTSGIGNQVARFLYANSFEFPVTCKIWMATNYEPVIRGNDKGIWRRIVKIPVPTDFTGREDKDLREKLMKELPQILGWLVEGYEMYQKEGLEQPDTIKQATADYRKEMDITQQWIDEYCECKSSYFERANTLYDSFRAFCQRRDQRTNQTIFGRNLGKKFKKYNSGEGIVYIGIRLKKEQSDLSKKVAYENIEVDPNV